MNIYRKENKLILELCKFLDYDTQEIRSLLMGKLDTAYVLGNIMLNRIGGIAYCVLNDSNSMDYVSREFKTALKTCYEMNRQKTQSFKKSLSLIYDILGGAGLKYALLKGAYLAYLYPEGYRTSNDVDMLVGQEDLDIICAILKGAGFVQGYISKGRVIPAARQEILRSRTGIGETIPFIKPIYLPGMEMLEIDINFSLDYKARQETTAVKDFINNSIEDIQTGKGALKTLSGEDFLIHLCAHLYKEAAAYNWVVMGRDLSLYKFCDIYMWIHQYFNELFVKRFVNKAKKYYLERECYYTLYNTRELFNMRDTYLDRAIEKLKPANTEFMNEIYNPEEKTMLRYKMDFADWLFYGDKVGALWEK